MAEQARNAHREMVPYRDAVVGPLLPCRIMRAVYAASAGGEHPLGNAVIGERPAPRPAPGEALVRLTACALNHHDLWTLRGISSRPVVPPQILGTDGTGTVEAYGVEPPPDAPPVGSRVVIHAVVGCRRCAACRHEDQLFCRQLAVLSDPPLGGTLAEFVAVPAENLIVLPDAVDHLAAACLPTAYLTAYRALFVRARLLPGSTLLVQGATGGVATAAVVLGRAAGVHVMVTSRSAEKRAYALDSGAEVAVAAGREGATEVLEFTGGRGVDAVLESVGEPTWEMSLRVVRSGGTIVVVGATGGANPPAMLSRMFWRHLTVAGSTMGTRAELERVVGLCAAGLRPLIDSVRPLADALAGLSLLERGEQRGKLILTN